jgi:hypothetical protein
MLTLSSGRKKNATSAGKGKGKAKARHRTGHEGPEGEYRNSSTLFLTSALDGVGGQATLWPLGPRERPGTHSTVRWVGPRAGLDGCGKSRPNRDSIPGPSVPERVAIPTELSRPNVRRCTPKTSELLSFRA